MTNPHIASIATASPDYVIGQDKALEFLLKSYSDNISPLSARVLKKVMRHPSVSTRRFAITSPEELVNEDPDKRMARFTQRAVDLSAQSADKALRKAGLSAKDIDAVVVNTCTGYICPGVSTYLIDRLGLSPTTKVYDLVGSGCGGAIPNLQLCEGLLKNEAENVLSISTEICSCAFRMDDDLSLIISNAIFGDGSAAAVIWNRPEGLEVLSSVSRCYPQYREDIRFIHKGGQLYNQLSARLPELAADAAKNTVDDLLGPAGLTKRDIKHWALHPGGENVLKAIENRMELTSDNLKDTRAIFNRYGNMSSPTVWYVAEQISTGGIAPGSHMVMLSFGAGLSAHAALLKSA